MTFWLDDASPQANDDLAGLLEPALEFATHQLETHGEFYPYALAVDHHGQQQMVAADTGSDRPPSAELIIALLDALTGQRDHLRAVALVADVRLPSVGGDAVRVTLEHAEQVALTVFLPYRTRRLSNRVTYGAVRQSPGPALIWPTV